jgi:hypothetical protein
VNNAQRFLNLVSATDTKEALDIFESHTVSHFPLGEDAQAWLFDDDSIAYIGPNRRDTFDSALALQEAVDLGPRALANNLWR